MSGHTPGPWTYFVGNANGRGLIRIETAHDAKPVAGAHIASMARGGVSEANARLIAAAPELLDACRGFVEEYGLRCGPADDLDPAAEQTPVVAAAMRAIAAATGEKA